MPFDITQRQAMQTLMGYIATIYAADSGVQNIADLANLIPVGMIGGGQFTKGAVPAYVWWQDDGQLIVLISGMTIPQQGLGLFGAAFLSQATFAGINFNQYLVTAIQAIAASLQGRGLSTSRSLCIVGHSYGGAVAQALTVLLTNGIPNAAYQILTFGSPRAGDNTLAGFCDSCTTVRVMTYGDPIPLFPPHFDEAPLATVALGFGGAFALSRFVQPGGGELLDQAGGMVPGILPPQVLPIADVNLATWAAGTNGFAQQEHYYGTYLRRLTPTPLVYGPPVPTTGAGLKGELEPVLTPQIFNLGPVQGPIALNGGRLVATISVFIPVAYRAKVVKVGINYTVVWMSVTIANGTTKSNAKTLAKYINKLLRVMQTVATVNHTTIGQALQNYLTVASSATGGFMPVLNVT